jgi:bacteriocin biosynthesis cyclodehydratase domain-containing protein
MIARPSFKRTYHVEVVEPDGVYLLSEGEPILLKGPLFCRLAPLLDGEHTVEQIAAALADDVSALQVQFALTFLERRGHIVEAADGAPPGRAAFWDALGVDMRQAERRLRETTVTVRPFGAVPAEPFIAALAGLGVRVGDAGALTVALVDDYLHEGLAGLNAASLADGHSWLLAKPLGQVLWLGPLFRPGETACWACLAQRLRLNRTVDGYLQQRTGSTAPFPVARATLPATVQAGCALAAVEVLRAIAGEAAGGLENRVLTLDVLSRATEQHAVVRRPQCPACGEAGPPDRQEPRPIELQARPKQYTADGGHRVEPPEATLARYEHHVSWLSGAVRHLERASVAATPLVHVYDSGENRAVTAHSLDVLRRGLRSRASGKGVTEAQARASALCEALERYSGLYQGDEARLRASYRALGERALHPNACMLYSERQYAERADWNARPSRVCRVPEPLDEAVELDWTPVWSLTARAPRYLPTAYCYYGVPAEAGGRYALASSNGAAAGNTLEEAILQGLLELVERDSVALWWHNRVRRPAVDLDSFDEPYFGALREAYRRLQREVWVLDLTSDLAIPVFAALSRRTDQPGEEITFGFGAHLDARIGVLRALTEMNQALPWVTTEREWDDTDEMDRWLRSATLAREPYLAPADAAPHTAPSYPLLSSDDLRDDVLRCQAIVEAQGLEVLVLDQTRPDLGLVVAKVFVPGLRPFWPRLAPGRLYDVPVRLGWLPAALAEEALNPIPMFW